MKAAVVFAIIGAALAAPIEDNHLLDETQRTKKSPSYGAPCAGAAPIGPVALYLGPQGPVLPHLNYREDEHDGGNINHDVNARSYYDSSAVAVATAAAAAAATSPAAAGLALTAPAGAGSAIGLFPNAKIGGCAIPLLLSCAPNVVPGHLAHHGGAYPAAYRTGQAEHQMREVALEKAWNERAAGQQVADVEKILASHHHHHDMVADIHQNHAITEQHQ